MNFRQSMDSLGHLSALRSPAPEWLPSLSTLLAAAAIIIVLLQQIFNKNKVKYAPGPRPWPILGNLPQLGTAPHRTMIEFTKKYGPIVFLRFGSVPTLVTNKPEIIRELVKEQDHVFCSRPKTAASEYIAYNGAGIALSPYGAHWRNMRKICVQELLTPSRIEKFQKERDEEASSMVRKIFEECENNLVDMRIHFGAVTMNMTTRMLLGKQYFGEAKAGEKEAAAFKKVIHDGFVYLGVFNIGDYIPMLRPLDLQGYERKMREVQKRQKAVLSKIVQDHKSKRTGDAQEPHDFVDVLLSLPGENGEAHLSDITIEALMLDMIAAATDTSSVTMEWALAELVRHPNMQKKVQEEIDLCVGGDRIIQESDLNQLQYLKAVLKETFRLHPGGPFLIPHMSLEATKVAGYDIPKHTTILINLFDVGQNPDSFDLPKEFLPERWLDGSKSVEMRDPEFKILPFGAGRRGCPGATLGQCFVMLALSRVLQAFDWTLPSGVSDLDMTEAYGLTTPIAEPLKVVATPRSSTKHLYA